MTPEEAYRRSAEAKQIIEAPLFLEARKFLDDQLAQLRRDVPIRETEMHTRIILMEQIAQKFYSFFELLAQTGKMEAVRLADEERRKSVMEQGLALFRRNGRSAI
jgi:hypothetical protein